MDLIKDFLPLLGVLLGAAISGVSQIHKAKLERKRSIAIALTDLLEVWHHLNCIKEVLDAFKMKYDIPAEVEAVLHSAIEEISPIDPELHKRYESAVSMLSGYDPLLAFFLRSRSTAPHLLSSIKGLGSANGIDASALGALSRTLLNTMAPALDQAVVKLASAHGWSTKRRVAKYLKESEGLPPETNALFAQLEKMVSELQDVDEPSSNGT